MKKTMEITLIRSEEGDWEGLYFDGNLITEGHSLTVSDVFNALNIPFKNEWRGEAWFEKHGGRCPQRLPE